jgi:hypothetical protein
VQKWLVSYEKRVKGRGLLFKRVLESLSQKLTVPSAPSTREIMLRFREEIYREATIHTGSGERPVLLVKGYIVDRVY